jgi:hypothetical protein
VRAGQALCPVVVLVVVFMAVCLAATVYRLRRGGPGPAVNYVPRAFRQSLDRRYERRGWQLPYDAEGIRNPDRSQL